MLATLIKPDEGDAVIGGYSVQKEAEQVRRKIGFLTSELRLEEFFTPNYLFDFFSDLHQVPANLRKERKKHLFEIFGIDGICGSKDRQSVYRNEAESITCHLFGALIRILSSLMNQPTVWMF